MWNESDKKFLEEIGVMSEEMENGSRFVAESLRSYSISLVAAYAEAMRLHEVAQTERGSSDALLSSSLYGTMAGVCKALAEDLERMLK